MKQMSRQGDRVGKACRKAVYGKGGKASTQEKGNTGRHGMEGKRVQRNHTGM